MLAASIHLSLRENFHLAVFESFILYNNVCTDDVHTHCRVGHSYCCSISIVYIHSKTQFGSLRCHFIIIWVNKHSMLLNESMFPYKILNLKKALLTDNDIQINYHQYWYLNRIFTLYLSILAFIITFFI